MSKIKKVIAKKGLPKGDFVSITTGLTLDSAYPNLEHLTESTDLVVIDYKRFISLNSEVMEFLSTILSCSDIGRIVKLSNMIKTNWNILYNKDTNRPYYSNSELAVDMEYTRSKFHLFINKMYKASVLYKMSGYVDGIERTVYILNPHLAKCTKTLNKNVLSLFQKLSEKTVQKKIVKIFNNIDKEMND